MIYEVIEVLRYMPVHDTFIIILKIPNNGVFIR